MTGKVGSAEVMRAGLGANNLSSECGHRSGFCSHVFMLGAGGGKWYLSVPLFLEEFISGILVFLGHAL